MEIDQIKKILSFTHQHVYSNVYYNIFFFISKKETHTQKQKARETKEEKKKTKDTKNETKEGKEKENTFNLCD